MQTLEGMETEISQIQLKHQSDRLEDITRIAELHKMIATQMELMTEMALRINSLEDQLKELNKR